MRTSLRMGILGLIFIAATAAANPADCVPRAGKPTAHDLDQRRTDFAQDRQVFRDVTVLVGVDVLGRVLAAVDLNNDGLADRFLKFTDQTRIQGPWSRHLQGARVTLTRGTAVIANGDGETVVAFAVEGGKLTLPEPRAKSAFVYPDGVEFINLATSIHEPSALTKLDHTDVRTWPVTFQSDLNGELDAVAEQTGCRRAAMV